MEEKRERKRDRGGKKGTDTGANREEEMEGKSK
jgi:hypothetical protein